MRRDDRVEGKLPYGDTNNWGVSKLKREREKKNNVGYFFINENFSRGCQSSQNKRNRNF